jgi:hypothetical protein
MFHTEVQNSCTFLALATIRPGAVLAIPQHCSNYRTVSTGKTGVRTDGGVKTYNRLTTVGTQVPVSRRAFGIAFPGEHIPLFQGVRIRGGRTANRNCA